MQLIRGRDALPAHGSASDAGQGMFPFCRRWCIAVTDGRTERTPRGDAQLLADIREQITELPSYGYRRACALVNRKRACDGAPRVNPKRVYRAIADNALLLPKALRRPQSSRAHTGTVSVQASDTRWVLRRPRDQVRFGSDRDRHVRQGLL